MLYGPLVYEKYIRCWQSRGQLHISALLPGPLPGGGSATPRLQVPAHEETTSGQYPASHVETHLSGRVFTCFLMYLDPFVQGIFTYFYVSHIHPRKGSYIHILSGLSDLHFYQEENIINFFSNILYFTCKRLAS
jgi:hypothetical protein